MHEYVDMVLLTVIVACILATAVDDSMIHQGSDNTTLSRTQEWVDIIFLAIFCLEAACKIFAFGAISWHGAYFLSVWNCLDFAFLMLMLASALAPQVRNAVLFFLFWLPSVDDASS